MSILKITSRQFREKQKDFFDLADHGQKIVIERGKKQAYVLTPVSDDDLYFTPEMLAKIDLSIQQVKEGKVTTIKNEDDLKKYLDSL